MLVAPSCVHWVFQRIVHHVVEVEHREARVEGGGNERSADPAMPSARAAASCASSPRAGVHRHARVTESIFCSKALGDCTVSVQYTGTAQCTVDSALHVCSGAQRHRHSGCLVSCVGLGHGVAVGDCGCAQHTSHVHRATGRSVRNTLTVYSLSYFEDLDDSQYG